MGDQNIEVLQQTLTGLCNVVGTLEKKIHNLSHNDTAQFTRISLTDSPSDDLEVRLSTFSAKLDGVRDLTEGVGFNTVVIYFNVVRLHHKYFKFLDKMSG